MVDGEDGSEFSSSEWNMKHERIDEESDYSWPEGGVMGF